MDLEYIRHTTEFQIFDRKSIKIEPKALAVTIIAMANADGGVIALGVDDDGTLTGVDGNVKRLNDLLRVPFDYCVPSVTLTPEYMEVTDVKGKSWNFAWISEDYKYKRNAFFEESEDSTIYACIWFGQGIWGRRRSYVQRDENCGSARTDISNYRIYGEGHNKATRCD